MPRRRAGACLLLVAAAAAVMAVVDQRLRVPTLAAAIAGALPALVQVLTAAIGVWLMYLFWPRREGRSAHCKRCGYHQERYGRLAPSCPECGAPWLWIGNTRAGRPIGQMGMVALGVGLCALAIGTGIVNRVAPWFILRLMPEAALLAQVQVLPDEAVAELWTELGRRKLPQATLDTLAGPLLIKKSRDGSLTPPAERVLFAAMVRPTAPPALAARYFASCLTARTEPPEPAAPWEPVRASATAVFSGRTLTATGAPRVVVLGALYLDDAPEPVERWEWTVVPEAAPIQERAMDASFDAPGRGRHRLRWVFWLAVGPASTDPIRWSNGQPALPAALPIRDRFENVYELIVRPLGELSPTLISPPDQPG